MPEYRILLKCKVRVLKFLELYLCLGSSLLEDVIFTSLILTILSILWIFFTFLATKKLMTSTCRR